MDLRKTIRDAIIIVVVVIAAVTIFGSRRPGPVERARQIVSGDHAASQQQVPVHASRQHAISDGEPIVRLDERSIGADWFDENVAMQRDAFVSRGFEGDMAGEMARLAVLELGMEELIYSAAAEEYEIEPDPGDIAAQEEVFRSSFGSEEEAERFLQEMGMDYDRVLSKWENDSVRRQLEARITEAFGVEPGTREAESALVRWLEQRILSEDWEFEDPELEELYSSYREAMLGEGDEEEIAVEETAESESNTDSNERE